MIRLLFLFILLLPMTLSVQAARLELADTLVLLASSRGQVSPSSERSPYPLATPGCWYVSTAPSTPAPPTRARGASAPPRCC